MSLKRRDFLSLTAAAAAVAATGPGLRLVELARARSPEEAASSLNRRGPLIDANRSPAAENIAAVTVIERRPT